MLTETQQENTEVKPTPFGARLQSAREVLGLQRKDAATQLRLNERVIIMMEKDRYPVDLPVPFIRGYLRAYAKLLQIPEFEIKKALEQIKPKTFTPPTAPLTPKTLTSGNYFMQIFTYLLIITLIALVAIWWYSHTNSNPLSPLMPDHERNSTIADAKSQQVQANTPSTLPGIPSTQPPSSVENKPPIPSTKVIDKPKKPVKLTTDQPMPTINPSYSSNLEHQPAFQEDTSFSEPSEETEMTTE